MASGSLSGWEELYPLPYHYQSRHTAGAEEGKKKYKKQHTLHKSQWRYRDIRRGGLAAALIHTLPTRSPLKDIERPGELLNHFLHHTLPRVPWHGISTTGAHQEKTISHLHRCRLLDSSTSQTLWTVILHTQVTSKSSTSARVASTAVTTALTIAQDTIGGITLVPWNGTRATAA